MEAVTDYLTANPVVVTLLVLFIGLFLLYCVLKKFLKFTLVVIFVFLLIGGVYLFKDPGSAPDKIKNVAETIKAGGQQIAENFGNFWEDTKELAGKAKKVPGDINRMLDTAKDEVGK